MSDKSPIIGSAAVKKRAAKLHERDCPGDEPLETRSIIHQDVHERDAVRELRRERSGE